jgi:hypothetical protein
MSILKVHSNFEWHFFVSYYNVYLQGAMLDNKACAKLCESLF